MSKNHQTQSIRKSSLHKLLFGYVQTLVTQCSYITINTYESIVSIKKLYNLAKLWKCKKYTIQFFKVNPLFTACFGSSFQMDSPNPWKWKNLNHLKKIPRIKKFSKVETWQDMVTDTMAYVIKKFAFYCKLKWKWVMWGYYY